MGKRRCWETSSKGTAIAHVRRMVALARMVAIFGMERSRRIQET